MVNWSNMQDQFRHTDTDTLLLLDCYDPGMTGKTDGKGTTEVIAVTNMEVPIAATERYSFIRSLVEELEYLSWTPSFSVAMLHQQLFLKMRNEEIISKFRTIPMPEKVVVNRRERPTCASMAHKSEQKSIVLQSLVHSQLSASQASRFFF